MSSAQPATPSSNLPSDEELHTLIRARALALTNFLQIDDEALFSKVPHLKEEKPFRYEKSAKTEDDGPKPTFARFLSLRLVFQLLSVKKLLS
jgi:hypothetical protein